MFIYRASEREREREREVGDPQEEEALLIWDIFEREMADALAALLGVDDDAALEGAKGGVKKIKENYPNNPQSLVSVTNLTSTI